MAGRRAINLDNVPEMVRKHKEGATLRALVEWLTGRGNRVSVETVRAELAKAGQAAEKRPELALTDAEPEGVADRIKALRYEIADERRAARERRGSDWKRYQGAIRMTMALIQMEARPASSPADSPSASETDAPGKPRFLIGGKPADLPS